jgi:hypothetical protein
MSTYVIVIDGAARAEYRHRVTAERVAAAIPGARVLERAEWMAMINLAYSDCECHPAGPTVRRADEPFAVGDQVIYRDHEGLEHEAVVVRSAGVLPDAGQIVYIRRESDGVTIYTNERTLTLKVPPPIVGGDPRGHTPS